MQVETHLLTAGLVLLSEAVLSMLVRGLIGKINRHKQIRNCSGWILTRGTTGFIGSEYVREVE